MSPAGAVLGVSFDYHDSAAAVVVGGEVVAAAEEERFSRRKHDSGLPESSMRWCLDHAGVAPGDLDAVVFYDKPLATYERIIVTNARVGPKGVRSLGRAVATWSRRKLWVDYRLDRALRRIGPGAPRVRFSSHHVSHAAAAFYPSPYDSAAILTFDGVGEWATASLGRGGPEGIEILDELRFPDSIGLLYSTVTALCGFDVNDGEYKLMGLAPFGEPTYADVLREQVVHVLDDGSLRLNPRMFDYQAGERMAHPRLHRLLGGSPRPASEPIGQREADLARSVQVVLEDIVLRMANHAHERTGEARVCLAGGVALNCVANSRLVAEGPFDAVWVQPAAGDDGGALGAALWAWHDVLGHERAPLAGRRDRMRGCQLGPEFADAAIADWLRAEGIPFDHARSDAELFDVVAGALDRGAIVGWFQGRMEFGPRALGNRSILGDPRDPTNVGRINAQVKGREGFRPFAPAVLEEDASAWFDVEHDMPFMTFTAQIRPDRRVDAASVTGGHDGDGFTALLGSRRSEISACTHVDGSARVQTVSRRDNERFHGLIARFGELTGVPVLLNTSFNAAGEPIVRTPADAVRTFLSTGLDVLALERCVIRRSDVEAV